MAADAQHPARYFSKSYEEARDRFRAASRAHAHYVDGGALEVVDGLTIDWAVTGDRAAEQLLIYSSGLHGVEGYVGSAAQLSLLGEGDATPTLWIHALNPYGMKHIRRVNENNVDLNRNFLPPGQAYRSDDEAYGKLDSLLNPKGAPGSDFFFLPIAAFHLARHGLATLRNVVARGQYSYPQGVFYGGDRLQKSSAHVLDLVEREAKKRKRVIHIDLHTARGKPGEYLAFLDRGQLERGQAAFGDRLRAWTAGSSDGYEMRGGMLPEIGRRLEPARFDGLTVEFGTASDIKIIRALRQENQLHFHGGGPGAPDHPARLAMRAVFAPLDESWQQRALQLVPDIGARARALLNAN